MFIVNKRKDGPESRTRMTLSWGEGGAEGGG